MRPPATPRARTSPTPQHGVLSGTWYDNSPSATSVTSAGATGNQLAAEAEAAAAHFGNLTQASNRDTQYVIASPTGADPDGWNDPTNGYCAYHDDTHDPFIDGGGPVSGPIAAFTNLPYVPDAGGSCGANFVNSGSVGCPRRSHVDGEPRVRRDPHRPISRDQPSLRDGPTPPVTRSPTSASTSRAQRRRDVRPDPRHRHVRRPGSSGPTGRRWSRRVASRARRSTPSHPTISAFTPPKAPAGASVTITGNDAQRGDEGHVRRRPRVDPERLGRPHVVAVVPSGIEPRPDHRHHRRLAPRSATERPSSPSRSSPASRPAREHRVARDHLGLGARRRPQGLAPRQEDDRPLRRSDSDHRLGTETAR